jgi:hypothetical protein
MLMNKANKMHKLNINVCVCVPMRTRVCVNVCTMYCIMFHSEIHYITAVSSRLVLCLESEHTPIIPTRGEVVVDVRGGVGVHGGERVYQGPGRRVRVHRGQVGDGLVHEVGRLVIHVRHVYSYFNCPDHCNTPHNCLEFRVTSRVW